MHPTLPLLHQIFIKAKKYMYSSPDSIKSSPFDGNTACSLIDASSLNSDYSNPNPNPPAVKFNTSGIYECDVNCIRYISYKICSHTTAAAEHKSELRNFVEYFKKHSKNKVNNDMVDVCLQMLGRTKLKVHRSEKRSRKIQAVIHQQFIYLQ